MGRPQHNYSDNEIASALAALQANGGNVNHTARQLGIPRGTLDRWAKGQNIHPDVRKTEQEKKVDLATKLEEVAYKLVEAMIGKIEKAPLKEVAVAVGISIEKMRLLRDEPTNIGESRGLTERERNTRILELVKEFRARPGNGPALNGAAEKVGTVSWSTNGSPVHTG